VQSPFGGGRGRILGESLILQQDEKIKMYITVKNSFFDLLSISSPCPIQRGIADAQNQSNSKSQDEG